MIIPDSYYTPWDHAVIRQSGLEAFMMLQDYAREHVLTCLVPAFFIAGAIAAFVSQASVLKYFGAKANKILSYSVASVSGTRPRRLLLHGIAPLCRHPHAGRRDRTGHGLSLFRSGHQHAGHHPDGRCPRGRSAWPGPSAPSSSPSSRAFSWPTSSARRTPSRHGGFHLSG